MSKEKIHNTYMEEMKKKHGWKKHAPRQDRMIAITGSVKKDSIGETIRLHFMPYIITFDEDVISDKFDFNGFTELIMCHGYTYMNWLEDMSNKETKKIIDVNLFGSIRVIKQFVKDTINIPYRKRIISIGSMAYNHVLNGSAAYCASKAGLNHFIKCAAWELAPKGFDVYIIHPSNVSNTPMTNDTIKHLMRYRKLNEIQARAYWASNNPRELFLTKKEIVQHIEYILLNDCSYLSGTPIELAGGQR
jgi:NAD(P)-dependent dehydrogenase (short-subunit alcohol dehydrogenase family)